MKKSFWLGVLALFLLLAIGGGWWAYANGYYHALRGGIIEEHDRGGAIAYYKIAYEKNPDCFMVAHDLACCYAVKDDKESCFYWLSIALKSHYGAYAKNWAKTEPDFASVRQTPEFQALIFDAPLPVLHR